MGWYNCSDCDYMNLTDKNRYNECYCSKRGHYYKPSDTVCNLSKIKGRDVGGSGNCYLTTAMCMILGYDDHCYYLDSLRHIRDDYMVYEADCQDLLVEYDTIGPKIAESLYKDPQNKQVATIMLEQYIKPAIEVFEKNPKESVNIYVNMTNSLMEKYNITREKQTKLVRQKKDE